MKLTDFSITKLYPPKDSNNIQLYSLGTPNGIKVSAMLELLGVDYDYHKIDISKNEQFQAEFLELNPNNKIPAIIDPNGPNGAIGIFDSCAILVYLAEKYGKFIPTQNTAQYYDCLQWLFFQSSGAGAMFGQLGFFHKWAGASWEDKRPLQRYVDESKRLLAVLDKQLTKHKWIASNDFTIVDIAQLPWINSLINAYNAADILEIHNYPYLLKAFDEFMQMEAVKRAYEKA
jgi:GST-like protein